MRVDAEFVSRSAQKGYAVHWCFDQMLSQGFSCGTAKRDLRSELKSKHQQQA